MTGEIDANLQLRLVRAMFSLLGSIFPSSTARYALYKWRSTRRRPVSAREQAFVQTAIIRTIQVNKHPVVTYVWGSGPAVMVVHGWNGRAGQFRGITRSLVAAGFQVVGFDAPGHGASPGSSSSVLEIAAVIQFMRNQYSDIGAVIAHSFGVPSVLYAMRDNPDLPFVSICGPDSFEGLMDAYVSYLQLPDSVVEQMKSIMSQRYSNELLEELEPRSNAIRWNAPVLLIHDEDDLMITLSASQRMADAFGDSKLLVTQGLGHYRVLLGRRPIKTVTRFIKEHSS